MNSGLAIFLGLTVFAICLVIGFNMWAESRDNDKYDE